MKHLGWIVRENDVMYAAMRRFVCAITEAAWYFERDLTQPTPLVGRPGWDGSDVGESR